MNKKLIESLAGMLNLNAEELAQAMASEDATIELPKGSFLNDSDLSTLKDNHGKERYDAGKTAGYEMSFKELSKAGGIETVKSGEDFIKAFKGKVLEEAKIEPEKKVQELTASMEKLQQQVMEKENAYKELESNIAKEKTRFKVQSLIPELPETLGLTKEEATDLFFLQHEVREDGVYRKGQLLKDKLENPLGIDDAATGFITEKGWNKPAAPTGRGGGAGGGSGKTKIATFEDFENELKTRGINPNSAEAQAMLAEAAKDNPEILD